MFKILSYICLFKFPQILQNLDIWDAVKMLVCLKKKLKTHYLIVSFTATFLSIPDSKTVFNFCECNFKEMLNTNH